MHFHSIITSFVGFAALASAQANFCPEALCFASLTVSPTTLSPGESFTIHANLTCTVTLGYTPTYLNYYIEVPVNNNGHEAPILITRRTYNNSTLPTADTFTAIQSFRHYFTGAQYVIIMDNSFAKPGPTGDSVITVGSISTGINFTGF
ncbi:hypothetical protein B0H10DRAFT_1802608 [Mycena sp. CBHHK59/15]|nr:hypothetical protein B0H10DRAFT_1802608 [Mycena sp. CBHHK59/15]